MKPNPDDTYYERIEDPEYILKMLAGGILTSRRKTIIDVAKRAGVEFTSAQLSVIQRLLVQEAAMAIMNAASSVQNGSNILQWANITTEMVNAAVESIAADYGIKTMEI